MQFIKKHFAAILFVVIAVALVVFGSRLLSESARMIDVLLFGFFCSALLVLPALQACSTTSAVPPPATPSLAVTPLPAEILQISTSDSQPVLQKARAWLASLSDWSSAETPRSAP